MNKQQALQLIKNILDAAIKSGVIISIEQASAMIQAFSVITQALKDDSTGN